MYISRYVVTRGRIYQSQSDAMQVRNVPGVHVPHAATRYAAASPHAHCISAAISVQEALASPKLNPIIYNSRPLSYWQLDVTRLAGAAFHHCIDIFSLHRPFCDLHMHFLCSLTQLLLASLRPKNATSGSKGGIWLWRGEIGTRCMAIQPQ